jgi:diguanylate cyclase (GGDEF)-like protein
VNIAYVAVGLAVLFLGFRVASKLSFPSQRLTMRFLLAAFGLWVLAGAVEDVYGSFSGSLASRAIIELVADGPVEILAAACTATGIYLLYRSDKSELASLRHRAITDELTNLPNQSFFRRAASRRLENSLRYRTPLACLILDIDGFKAYNDAFGHESGNAVLRCVAETLGGSARADDLVARYGGDEFVMLFNGGLREAVEVAGRIREQIETRCSPRQELSLFRPVTVSIGVAALVTGMSRLEDLIGAADEEMYRAKRAGKNAMSVDEYHRRTGTE